MQEWSSRSSRSRGGVVDSVPFKQYMALVNKKIYSVYAIATMVNQTGGMVSTQGQKGKQATAEEAQVPAQLLITVPTEGKPLSSHHEDPVSKKFRTKKNVLDGEDALPQASEANTDPTTAPTQGSESTC